MKAVCFDFDGTIVERCKTRLPDSIGELREGAKEFIIKLKGMGYEIVIASGRFDSSYDGLNAWQYQEEVVQKFLDKNGIPCDRFSPKPFNAVAYIDDRGVSADKSWDSIFKDIIKLSRIKDD